MDIDRASFLNVTKWLSDVRNAQRNEVLIMIVGNKTDLTERRSVNSNFGYLNLLLFVCRAVTTAEGEELARQENVMFIETSAKAGYNVKALFRKLAIALPSSDAASAPTTTPCTFKICI